MEAFEHMEKSMHEFKKYADMTMDLMVDSFKWKTLAHKTDDVTLSTKYKHISESLMGMFNDEFKHLESIYRGE